MSLWGYAVLVKDIPSIDKHLSFTIEQNSHIDGPTSRPFLRARIVYWAIPIFNQETGILLMVFMTL